MEQFFSSLASAPESRRPPQEADLLDGNHGTGHEEA